VQLVSKISNVITIHQRYRRTDGRHMRSQDRALHYSASRGKDHPLVYI